MLGEVKIRPLTRSPNWGYIYASQMIEREFFRGVAQLGLECLTGGQEVAGSNPVAPIGLD